MRLRLVTAAALAGAALLALAMPALGTFAAQSGFSGRVADCSACHTRPMPGFPPAEAVLDGFPATYEAGAAYTLGLAVRGGPPASPLPDAPKGGFELEVSAGTLAPGPGMEGLLRHAGPRVLTYEPAGTLHRSWTVVWTAPSLEAEPGPAHAWLAVVAANGDHLVALNRSDAGERFDHPAALQGLAGPAPQATEAWRALPLRPPVVTGTRAGPVTEVDGRLGDANATVLRHRLDGGPWTERPVADAWRVRYDGVAPGHHVLEVASAGHNRTSPAVHVPFAVADAGGHVPGGASPVPAPPIPLLAAVLVAALAFRRRTP